MFFIRLLRKLSVVGLRRIFNSSLVCLVNYTGPHVKVALVYAASKILPATRQSRGLPQ